MLRVSKPIGSLIGVRMSTADGHYGTAYKIIESVSPDDSAANVLAEPTLVVKATGVQAAPGHEVAYARNRIRIALHRR
jgi:hypothetical protein